MGKDLSAKIIINAEDRSAAAFNKTKVGLDSLDQRLQKIQTRFSQFLALSVSGIISNQIGEVVRTADAYKTLEARLKLVSDNSKEYAIAQKELFQIAQRTRGHLQATSELYGKVETAVKQLGGSQKQALETTETINQAIALSGGSAEAAANGIRQFIQGLDGGALRGEEFNSVMENTPGLAQALADGLGVAKGQLRGMAEAGELTADRLINALGKSAPKVAEQFKQLPVTVGGAMTQLNNAVAVFIGNADKSTGASAKLASGIQTVAKNLDSVVRIGEIAAELYGAKLVLGLSRSTQAMIENNIAAKQKAIADVQAREASILLLRGQTELAAANVRNAHINVEVAKTELALATTQKARAGAITALAAAQKAFDAAMAKSNAKQEKLTATLAQSVPVISKAEKGFHLLNGALTAVFAFDIGKGIGEWLTQFEQVRHAGSYLSETFALITSGIEGMFSGLSLSERFAQIQQIHAEFQQIRADDTNAARQQADAVATTEQQKTQAIEQAAQLQAASFKKVQEATTALTAQIDTDAKAQTAAIQQALAEKTAAIDASDASDLQKIQLKLQATLQAGQQELQLQQQFATEKLNLIDAEYAKELQSATANKDRQNQLESEKKQAKLSVYQGLADFFQAEVNKLVGVYNQETQAAADSRKQLKDLALTSSQEILDIERQGLAGSQLIESQKTEFAANQIAIKKELAKGELTDQDKVNELLSRQRSLSQSILSEEIAAAPDQAKRDSAVADAKDRIKTVIAGTKEVLEKNVTAHEKNAAEVGKAIAKTQTSLDSVKTTITDITSALNKELLIKIGMDGASLTAAQSTIADLVKPETKTITIQTIQRSGSAAVGGGDTETGSGIFGTSGQKTGGPAGHPTHQLWRFMTGGFTPKTGQLPGFGGGDKIRALLEAGEFIIRKEAVQKFGVPFMYALNAGQMPPLAPIKRARGGSVDVEDEVRKRQLEEIKQRIKNGLLSSKSINRAGLAGTGGAYNPSQAMSTIQRALDEFYNVPGLHIDRRKVNDIITNTVGKYGDKDLDAKFARRDVLLEHLFDEPPSKKFEIPQLPDSVTNFGQAANQNVSTQTVAPEVIKLDLSFNGQTAAGTFPKTDATRALLSEIKRAGGASA